MAIVKHISSKNADYHDVPTYLIYQHKEITSGGKTRYEPILDGNGLLQERADYAIVSLNAEGEKRPPEDWAAACMRINFIYGKNQDYKDRKTHTYIISLPSEDRPNATKKALLETGERLVRTFFAGYEALVAVHMDTGNPHIHIVINSVRTLGRPEREWMSRDQYGEIRQCEIMAGGKHQDGTQLRRALNDWMLEECQRQGWSQRDNNAIADARKEERYSAQHQRLREILIDAASKSKSIHALKQRLAGEYGVELRIRGHTVNILPPNAKRAVRLTTLGMESSELFEHMADKWIWGLDIQYQSEEKRYIDWVRYRRKKNEEKAEEAHRQFEQMLNQRFEAQGERYRKENYPMMNRLLEQCKYLTASLSTERDKIALLEQHWDIYLDEKVPQAERRRCQRFVSWCGCDPDSKEERRYLASLRRIVELRRGAADEMCRAVVSEIDKWKYYHEEEYIERDLQWLKRREGELKQDIKETRRRVKKLGEIHSNYLHAARRWHPLEPNTVYFNTTPKGWEKVAKYADRLLDAMEEMNALEATLREVQKAKGKIKGPVNRSFISPYQIKYPHKSICRKF